MLLIGFDRDKSDEFPGQGGIRALLLSKNYEAHLAV